MSTDQDHGTSRGSDDAQSPSDEQRAGWRSVQQRAKGLNHHQAKAALEAARQKAEESSRRDGPEREQFRAEAEIEEWERIAEALADHAGRYDPDTDPFVQGELAGQADREPGLPSGYGAA
ncbi:MULTISPECIES: hypothetical protein [unclassified Streptomyces]|uniref:hypothetical protein n=1 Tax=unclassified Streptomyces TaxID=2593676 RepID=UPI002E21069F|nr:hypothetical protein OG217_00530 [Streptomyces sp. NBC_01023]